MTGSIQFNTQFGLWAIKIKNIWSNTELTSEFESK